MKRPLLRLLFFIISFCCFVAFADVFLIRTDLFTRAMMYELQNRSDIRLAFVGSSVCRNHINASLIEEKTGLTVFNASVPDLAMQGSIALTRELYRSNQPETVVLVVDAYTFDTDLEAAEAEDMLMPWLSEISNRIEYYRNLTASDGWYLDRLLLFRDFGATGLSDVLKTTALRLFPRRALSFYGNTAQDLDLDVVYEGAGFLRYDTGHRADEDIRARMQRVYTGWNYALYPRSKEMLLQYRDYVSQNGSRLLVLITPSHTVHQLADPSYFGYTLSLMQFCHRNGIECVNFQWAKPELLPYLDSYYYDLFHMSGEGADLFSAALAGYLNRWLSGEETSALFYGSQAEYLETVDFITNVWIEEYDPEEKWNKAREQNQNEVLALSGENELFLANCNHGSLVMPEYRFALRARDGSEILSTEWQTEGIFLSPAGTHDACTLRVYARPAGAETEPVWYDYVY